MTELQAALDTLAAAHGPKALAIAHRQLQSAARRRRQEGTASTLRLARAVEEALQLRDAQKAAGVTGEALGRGLEAVVREVWPKPASGRTEPWKYLCNGCCDTGLALAECVGTNGICGRGKAHAPHEFGRPCWCEKGAAFRIKTRTAEDAIAVAAKTAKPSRFGQR